MATCVRLLGRPEPGKKEQRLGEGGRRGGKTRRRREERKRADGRAGKGAAFGTYTGRTSCPVGGEAEHGEVPGARRPEATF